MESYLIGTHATSSYKKFLILSIDFLLLIIREKLTLQKILTFFSNSIVH